MKLTAIGSKNVVLKSGKVTECMPFKVLSMLPLSYLYFTFHTPFSYLLVPFQVPFIHLSVTGQFPLSLFSYLLFTFQLPLFTFQLPLSHLSVTFHSLINYLSVTFQLTHRMVQFRPV